MGPDDLLDRPVVPLRAIQGGIDLVQVRLVVLVVVEPHRLLVDVRLEGVVRIRQRRQLVGHCVLSFRSYEVMLRGLALYGATRPDATNASYVIGIRSAKKTSTASAYLRISRWAVSAARSEMNFMSARALTVQ